MVSFELVKEIEADFAIFCPSPVTSKKNIFLEGPFNSPEEEKRLYCD